MFQATINTGGDLGIAMQQARLTAGLSQRELAARVGSSQRYVWELESGKEFIAIERVLAALNAVGARLVVELPEGDLDG